MPPQSWLTITNRQVRNDTAIIPLVSIKSQLKNFHAKTGTEPAVITT